MVEKVMAVVVVLVQLQMTFNALALIVIAAIKGEVSGEV